LELEKADLELVREAEELLARHHSEISGVAVALQTTKARRYYGLDIDLELSPVSICAEYSAIGNMVTNGERAISTIVAVSMSRKPNEYNVLPPCGKCREFMRAFGNPYVILKLEGKRLRKTRLSNLLPMPFEPE